MPNQRKQLMLLAYPFRIFFLLVAIYAIAIIGYWLGVFLLSWPLPQTWPPPQWHSHELVFGVVAAAIAGFLLTAMANWTGAKALSGIYLLLMVLVWLAGRMSMWFIAWLPPSLVLVLDMAFFIILAVYVATILIRHGNYHNLVMVIVLLAFSLANALMHVGSIWLDVDITQRGQQLAFNGVAILMVVVAGRITPAFSKNWLRGQGRNPDVIKNFPIINGVAIASVVLLAAADFLSFNGTLVTLFLVFAGLANLLRVLIWAGWHVRQEPLLWVLHIAYLFIPLALFARASSHRFSILPESFWVHLFGIGGAATLILGVMTRVVLGHTGRPLVLPRGGVFIYFSIIAAALFRIGTALQVIPYTFGISMSSLLWVAAFLIFIVLYWPLLSRPRIDGRPG